MSKASQFFRENASANFSTYFKFYSNCAFGLFSNKLMEEMQPKKTLDDTKIIDYSCFFGFRVKISSSAVSSCSRSSSLPSSQRRWRLGPAEWSRRRCRGSGSSWSWRSGLHRFLSCPGRRCRCWRCT